MALQLYSLRNVSLLYNNFKNLNKYFPNFPLKSCTQLFYATNVKNHKLFYRPSASFSISTINDNNRYKNNNNYNNIIKNKNIINTEIMSQKRFFHDGNIFNYSMQEQSFEYTSPTSPNGSSMPVKKYYRKAAHRSLAPTLENWNWGSYSNLKLKYFLPKPLSKPFGSFTKYISKKNFNLSHCASLDPGLWIWWSLNPPNDALEIEFLTFEKSCYFEINVICMDLAILNTVRS
ncbi:hypothetical protein CVS40_2200 [Lucilia cuprina]|nr:hypothetical protein CVS40_2200 [Lucilia cuprina]